jgi:hypothetical protein
MPVYTQQTLGTNLSDIVTGDDGQDEAIRCLELGSVEPTVRIPGLLWQCTDSARIATAGGPSGLAIALLRWNGSAWVYLAALTGRLLSANGATTLTANLPCGGFILTGLGAGSANGHGVRYEQALLRNGGSGGLLANLNANSNRIVGLAAPVDDNDAARKIDVTSVPFAGRLWYNTNRDAAGLGTGGTVKQQTDGNSEQATLGFVPRELLVRVLGRFRVQGSNAIHVTGDTTFTREFFLRRWADQSAGGDAGSPTIATFEVNPQSGGGSGVYAVAEWRTGAGSEGFSLRFRGGGGGGSPPDAGTWLRLRSPSDANADGAIHVIAR